MNTVIQDQDEVIEWIPPDWIIDDPDASNPRTQITTESVASLAASIKRVGMQYPIICRQVGDDFAVIDGGRRLAVARLLGMRRVPTRVLRNQLTIAEVRARQLICNMHRLDLNPLDRAMGLQNFMSITGFSAEEAAENLDLSAGMVSKALSMLKLPDPLKAMVADKSLSADSAYLLARVDDPAAQAELAAKVVAGGLTRDALSERVRELEAGRKPSITRALASAAKAATFRISRSLGVGVSLSVSGAGDGNTPEGLFGVLERFVVYGRSAAARGVSIIRLLSDFNHSLAGASNTSRPNATGGVA